jgi:hypothetical protein
MAGMDFGAVFVGDSKLMKVRRQNHPKNLTVR